jgi:hypothetical protein
LAAIDNGLAFPVKHPEVASRFRQFPFGWATLSWSQKVRLILNNCLILLLYLAMEQRVVEVLVGFDHSASSLQVEQ